VNTDAKESLRHYLFAAERGFVDAQFNLGVKYHNGDGVEKNEDLALIWLKRAADGGHPDAKSVFE